MKHPIRNSARAALALLTALLLALAALPALADGTDEATVQGLIQTVIDRCVDENTLFLPNEEVAVGDFLRFTLTDVSYLPADEGRMYLCVKLLLQSTDTYPDGVGVSDYDFIVAERPDGVEDVADFRYTLPEAAYARVGNHLQALAWPITAYPDEAIEVMLLYDLPLTATAMALINTNAMEMENGPEPQGNVYSFSILRCVADFNLFNNAQATIAELYAIPSDGDGWGDNLMAGYSLSSGSWSMIAFRNSFYADSDAEKWDIKVVLESGQETFFTDVPLRELVELTFQEGFLAGEYKLRY